MIGSNCPQRALIRTVRSNFFKISWKSMPLTLMIRALALPIAALSCLPYVAAAQDGPPPADAIPPSPAEKYAKSKGGVDMRTGQYVYSKTDLEVSGPGGISLTRNSGSEIRYVWKPMGQFSHNWHLYLGYKPIKGGGANFTVQGARGENFISGSNTNSFVTRTSDYRSELKAVPTGPGATDRYFVYTAADGAKITFRGQSSVDDQAHRGQIMGAFESYYASKIENPDGTTFTLAYDAPTTSTPAFLRRVTSSTGYVLIFEWVTNPVDKFISKACLYNASMETVPASNSCSSSTYKTAYSYGSNGYMTTAVDALSESWTYSSTYSEAAWQLAFSSWPSSNYTWTEKYFHPGESAPYLTNTKFRNPFYQYVQSQAFATGESYSYVWNIVEHNEQSMEVAGGAATDANGKTMSVGYQHMMRPGHTYGDSYLISEGPNKITDELGRELNSDYCVTIVIGSQTPFPGGATGCAAVSARYWKYPDDRQTDFTYDVRGNILTATDNPRPASSEPVITQTFTYDCSHPAICSKPSTIEDGNGHTTNISYSSVHGGILKRTLPADPSGVRPETRYNYAQLYPWLKSGAGYVRAATPVWMLVSEEFCRTSASDASGNCAAGASDEVVTTYEYEQGSASGGSNLRLLGTVVTADGPSLRSCISYDKWGRKISETAPKAGLASCQ
jgi:hypothetical protein